MVAALHIYPAMDKEPEGWSRDETLAAYERGVWTFLLFAGGGLIALVGWLLYTLL